MDNDWKSEIIEALKVGDIRKAQTVLIPHIPKKLYKHFTVSEYTLDSLDREAIWLSNPSDFNDPYDSSASLISETMKPSWEDELRELGVTPEVLSAIKFEKQVYEMARHRDNMENLRKSLRVACFCEVNDSILMWSHYSNHHKGICVEYDLTDLVSTSMPPKCFLYPVIYSKTLFDTRPYLNESYVNPFVLMMCSLYKFDVWSYEKEWRLMTASFVLPEPGHLQIPKPTAIYMGSRIKEEDIEKLKKRAVEKGIKLFKTDFDPLEFAMRFSEIKLG